MSFEAEWSALRDDARVRRFGELAAGSPRHGRALLVGGCLRDAALGIPTKDLDLVVERDAALLAESYAALTGATVVRLGGDRFAAIRVVEGKSWIDILGLDGTTLDQDLRRRDLTVNAVACDVASGEVVDPTGGLDDLLRRRLRASRPGVFADDPLRALRLARFALTLPGFTVEEETLAQARASARALEGVARERIRDELDRILDAPDLAAALAWLDRIGLSAALFGEESARRLRLFGERWAIDPNPEDRLARNWARLAAASADPAGAREVLGGARRRGLLARATFESAQPVLAPEWTVPGTGAGIRLWLHAAGVRWREAVALRAALARDAEERSAWQALAERIEALGEGEMATAIDPPVLLDGDEAQALLGVGPGRELGAALAALRRAQIEGEIRDRPEAERFLRRLRV